MLRQEVPRVDLEEVGFGYGLVWLAGWSGWRAKIGRCTENLGSKVSKVGKVSNKVPTS